MKSVKYVLIAALGFFGIASAVFFSSCEVDPCMELSCKNGGSCANGLCQCPVGYEGAECEIKSADRFIGTYAGLSRCGIFPAMADTAYITLKEEPDVLEVKAGLSRTSILKSVGVAQTPYIIFPTYEDDGVRVVTSATIDNDQLTFYVETLNKQTSSRQVCTFIGVRINDSL